jgi:hypothetical protein
MEFFYDLNKRLSQLDAPKTTQLNEGAKPDFLDIDKDGNRAEPMTAAAQDAKFKFKKTKKKIAESFEVNDMIRDYFGQIYDRGDEALDYLDSHAPIWTKLFDRYNGNIEKIIASAPPELLQRAVNELEKVLSDLDYELDEADVGEGNEFSGELAQAKAAGAKEFSVDGKTYPVKEEKSPFTNPDYDPLKAREYRKKMSKTHPKFYDNDPKKEHDNVMKWAKHKKPQLPEEHQLDEWNEPGLVGSKYMPKTELKQHVLNLDKKLRSAGYFPTSTHHLRNGITTPQYPVGDGVMYVNRKNPMMPPLQLTSAYSQSEAFAALKPKKTKVSAKKPVLPEEDVAEATKEVPGGRRHTAEPGGYGRRDDEEAPKTQTQRGRGRPKKGSDETGDVKKYDWSAFGATGKAAKLPAWDKKKTVKHKMVDESEPGEEGEYGREGDMAKEQLHTIKAAAAELKSILSDEQDLPEWVQSKITKAMDYIDTARDYMLSQHDDATDDVEPVQEKAVSKKQQKFMGMVHAAQKGEKPASKEVAKVAKEMPKKAAKDFAATKHKGLPEKKKEESVDETTTSGSVATATDTPKKSKGGMTFGKGIYDSWNRELESMIAESVSVNVSMSNSEHGAPSKNITITADGQDADRLAELLQMSGIAAQAGDDSCPVCHQAPCGCSEQVAENQPDWPTDAEYSDDALQYSGGLNKPKSTGQTTTPVIASQTDRQAAYEGEDEDDQALRLMKERAGIADGKYTQHGMDANRPSGVKPEPPENPEQTPWKTDPIAAASDRLYDKFSQLYKAYKGQK